MESQLETIYLLIYLFIDLEKLYIQPCRLYFYNNYKKEISLV